MFCVRVNRRECFSSGFKVKYVFSQTKECLFAPHCCASGSAETGMCDQDAPNNCVSFEPPQISVRIVLPRPPGLLNGIRRSTFQLGQPSPCGPFTFA